MPTRVSHEQRTILEKISSIETYVYIHIVIGVGVAILIFGSLYEHRYVNSVLGVVTFAFNGWCLWKCYKDIGQLRKLFDEAAIEGKQLVEAARK